MNTLVIGGTGTVGSQVVSELLARGASVRVLTRSEQKAGALPAGVQAVTGDLLDPRTARSVFQDIEAVFLLNAVSTTECHEGLMAVNGIRMAGVKRVAYLSVHEADRAPYLPHFGAKIPIEMAIKSSGAAWTILRPNNFYQNDYWFQDVLLQHGVYPQPIGTVGLSRVDVRDIAEAAAIALTTGEHDGETYNLVGPDVWTGPATADVWSQALGKPIVCGGGDLDQWEQQALATLPASTAFDFRQMYAFFQKEGLQAAGDDIERMTRLLGHAPRGFREFTRETAKMWQSAG